MRTLKFQQLYNQISWWNLLTNSDSTYNSIVHFHHPVMECRGEKMHNNLDWKKHAPNILIGRHTILCCEAKYNSYDKNRINDMGSDGACLRIDSIIETGLFLICQLRLYVYCTWIFFLLFVLCALCVCGEVHANGNWASFKVNIIFFHL